MASQPIYYYVLVWDESTCTNKIVDAFTDPRIAFAVADFMASKSVDGFSVKPNQSAVARSATFSDNIVANRRLTIDEYEQATREWGAEVPDTMKPSVLEDSYCLGDIFEDGDDQYMLIAAGSANGSGANINLVMIKGRWIGTCVHRRGFDTETDWNTVPAPVVRELLELVFNKVELKRVKRIPRPE